MPGIRITLLDTAVPARWSHRLGVLGRRPLRSGGSPTARSTRGSSASPALEATDTRRIGAAIHSVRAVDPDAIGSVQRWATDAGAVVHAHVSEQPAENEACLAHHGRTPTRLLADAGVLTDRFTAVHATHLTDADIAALAAAGSTVAMCPTTERDLGDGIGPTRQFADGRRWRWRSDRTRTP